MDQAVSMHLWHTRQTVTRKVVCFKKYKIFQRYLVLIPSIKNKIIQ